MSVRRLTAAVSSAIATIAVDGPHAADVLRPILVNASGKAIPLDQPAARFARWRFNDQELADEHVVVLVRDPQSIEIHCHGGLAITERILAQLQAAGCELQTTGRLHEKRSDSQSPIAAPAIQDRCFTDADIAAAARQALQNATTLKASVVWLEQYQGALARELSVLRQLISDQRVNEARELCDQLLARARFGVKLLQPWRLTLAGPPNVGKSSLMNALCGAARVLVHDQPGTTRDAIEASLVIGDWPLSLTDTAGIRESSELVEQLGIETAWKRWQSADVGLLVVDATVGWSELHDAMLIGPAVVIVVVNKVDALADAGRLEQLIATINSKLGAHTWPIRLASAKVDLGIDQVGIDQIVESIGDYLDGCRPPVGSGIPFLNEHIDWLEKQRVLLA